METRTTESSYDFVHTPDRSAGKLKRLLAPGTYLVTAANHLLHSKSESKESMLTGLTIL
jgi:hypothetical protein